MSASTEKKAIPLNIQHKDILCFPLSLSRGDISNDKIRKQQETVIKNLISIYTDESKQAAQDMLETAQKTLKELTLHAKNGETIRIWTSDMPDEACGFHWILEQLKPIGFDKLNITYVKLPDFHVMPDNAVVIYSRMG